MLFIQIFFGFLFLLISPVTAASAPSPDLDPRIGWEKSLGVPSDGGRYSVIATSEGGSVVIGNKKPEPGKFRFTVIKTDSEGNKIWDWTDSENTYEEYSIIETEDKGYVVAGSSNTTHAILLLKLDPSGKTVWTREFEKGDSYFGNSLSTTHNGGIIVAGSILRDHTSPVSLWEGYALKTDADGREQWTGFFTGEKNYFPGFIRQSEDGGYIIAGISESPGSAGSPALYLFKMNEFGTKEWFTEYVTTSAFEKPSVIQTPDGSYILLGKFPSGSLNPEVVDLFLVKTDDSGNELWRKKIPGMGKTAGNLLIQARGGLTIIAGSPERSEQEPSGKLFFIDLDLNGSETRNRSLSIGQSFTVQDIADIPGEGYFIVGIVTDQANPQKNEPGIIKVLDKPFLNGVAVKNAFDLTILTKDAATGTLMGGALVYLDGGAAGITSEQNGKQFLGDVQGGTHTIRVAKTGYNEITRTVDVSEKKQVSISLNRSNVIPLQIQGPPEDKIDIVFVASETSFNCNSKTKVHTKLYTGDQQRFIADVNDKVNSIFLTLDTLTSGSVGLPKDFRERFNFYYYWDNEDFADAFNGCAGTLPDEFWNEAPFTDVAIILYPSYEGSYSGTPCEPNGCANGLGPGSGSWLKAPADSPMIFLHESGHVVFGLIDTYCGDTYYIENSPFPNVWSSEYSCKKNAEKEGWDSASCRQILKTTNIRSKNSCVKTFWRVDPDPDIMGSGAYSGRFGNASTSHIRYIFDTINRWQK
jgi:hypothetical protein